MMLFHSYKNKTLLGVKEIAQLVKSLFCKHEDMHLDPQHLRKKVKHGSSASNSHTRSDGGVEARKQVNPGSSLASQPCQNNECQDQ